MTGIPYRYPHGATASAQELRRLADARRAELARHETTQHEPARGERLVAASGGAELVLGPAPRLQRSGATAPDLEVDLGTRAVRTGAGLAAGRAVAATARFARSSVAAPGPWRLYRVTVPGADDELRLELGDPGRDGDPAAYRLAIGRSTGEGFQPALIVAASGEIRRGDGRTIELAPGAPAPLRQPIDPSASDPRFRDALVQGLYAGLLAGLRQPILFGAVEITGARVEGVKVEAVGAGVPATTTTSNGTFVIGQAGAFGQLALVRFTRDDLITRTVVATIGRFLSVRLTLRPS